MEISIVFVSTSIEELEELVTPKLVPLAIPKIGVGANVTLINTITHAFEVFKTLNTILKNTLVVEIPKSKPIP
jgi:hypothetical protein